MKPNFANTVGIFCVLAAMHAHAQEIPHSQTAPILPTQHVVASGDNLEKIARLHGCRVSDLLNANGLKTDSIIHPGQKITLPAKDHAPLAVSPQTPATPQAVAATHTVAAGETFAAIARQHGIPLNELLAANPDVKPTALRPGQKVLLGKASAPSKNHPLDDTNTKMILATREEPSLTEDILSPVALTTPPQVKIQPIKIDREMTYLEFASRQGTNTRRLNQLNGLDLLDSALLAKGSELLAPALP